MKSRTSCFEPTLFWKTVRRFWPVWAAWLMGWLLLLPLPVLANRYVGVSQNLLARQVSMGDNLLSMGLYVGGVGGMIVAMMSAVAVFSDLYSTRMAHGMACLPVKRGSAFLSRALAGLLPLLAANVLVFGVMLLVETTVGVVVVKETAQWLLIVSLLLLCFYGVAVFCAQLTGNIVLLPVLYIICNFLAVGTAAMLGGLFDIYVFGAQFGIPEGFGYLSPIYAIFSNCRSAGVTGLVDGTYRSVACRFEGMGLLGVYAAVGAALLAVSGLLFRARRMESAGDVVAVQALKPVFRWGVAIESALALSMLLYVFFNVRFGYVGLTVMLLVGGLIGWFAAEMLIHKTFRVFAKRIWLGYGLCAVLLVAFVLGLRFDITGYERYIPEPAQVESVLLFAGGWDAELSEEENLEAMSQLHGSIVARRPSDELQAYAIDWEKGDYQDISIDYLLKNGKHVIRRYDIFYPNDDAAAQAELDALQALMNVPEAIAARKELGVALSDDTFDSAYVSVLVTAEEAARLSGYAGAEEWLRAQYRDPDMDLSDPAVHEKYMQEFADMNAYVSGSDLYIEYEGSYATEDFAAFADPDPANALFWYEYSLTADEAMELYESCIVPDMADGTIGLVWLRTGNDETYAATACPGEFYMTLRVPDEEENGLPRATAEPESFGWSYSRFSIRLTTSAKRTNAWLAAAGVPVRSVVDCNAMSWIG